MLDTLLLMDIMESFRTLCFDIYGLDMNHFLTLPALSWSACLKTSKIKLEIVKDVDKVRLL